MRKFETAVIEGGHVYVDPTQSILKDKDFLSAEYGIKISLDIYKNGKKNFIWWFIDDLHKNGQVSPIYKDLPAQWGSVPYIIMTEADPSLNQEALDLIPRFPKDQLLEYRKGIVLKGEFDSNYGLCKKNDSGLVPSCNLIDAALYIRKFNFLNRRGGCITILPEEYINQQTAVHAMLDALKEEIPVINVYFNNKGEISTIADNQKNL